MCVRTLTKAWCFGSSPHHFHVAIRNTSRTSLSHTPSCAAARVLSTHSDQFVFLFFLKKAQSKLTVYSEPETSALFLSHLIIKPATAVEFSANVCTPSGQFMRVKVSVFFLPPPRARSFFLYILHLYICTQMES